MTLQDNGRFVSIAGPVARALLGPENKSLSDKRQLRWGNRGSLSVNLATGQVYDHTERQGGGVLWLVEREKGFAKAEAVEWLKEQGFEISDNDPPKYKNMNNSGSKKPGLNIVKTYDYTDAGGSLVFQVCRLDPKDFRQRRPNGNGWLWSVAGIQQVPYRLPELMADISKGQTVVIAEGEKDVDNLRAAGIPATCNAMGAGKWPDELCPHFRGADVVIVPDNDDPGRKHVELVGSKLAGIAKRIRVLNLPLAGEKEDVSDWLAAGNDAAAFFTLLVDEGRDWRPTVHKDRRLGRISIGEIAARKQITPPQFVIDGWMVAREQSFLAGESQSGKSFLALHAAMSIATGRPVLGRKTNPGLVIYQAGESGFGVTGLRIPAWIDQFGEGVDFDTVPFEIIPDRVNLFRPDGNAEEFHQVVKAIQKEWEGRAELRAIIIDTMSKVMAGANENDGRDVGRVLEHGERLSRETGAHVCFVHHLPKSGVGMRGHGSLKGDTDSVVMVRNNDEGIRTVLFDKVKDGEAGEKLSFELRQVTIGFRDDGERITSCVVIPPSDAAALDKAEKEKPFTMGVNEAPIFAALMTALKKGGRVADSEMEAQGVPPGTVAVDWNIWREEYRLAASPDADGNPPSDEAISQHAKRYGTALHRRFHVIGRSGRWLWWTGKKVRNFPETWRRADDDRAPDNAGGNAFSALDQEITY